MAPIRCTATLTIEGGGALPRCCASATAPRRGRRRGLLAASTSSPANESARRRAAAARRHRRFASPTACRPAAVRPAADGLAAKRCDATGLVQPGSLIAGSTASGCRRRDRPSRQWTTGRGGDAAFPDAGWRVIRTRDDASPGLQRNIDRLARVPDPGRPLRADRRRGRRRQCGAGLPRRQARRHRHAKCLGAPAGSSSASICSRS